MVDSGSQFFLVADSGLPDPYHSGILLAIIPSYLIHPVHHDNRNTNLR